MSRYDFVTEWTIPASRDRVWVEIMQPEQWPVWWRGVKKVDLLQPGVDELGSGAIRRYTWRSRLPYNLTFTMQTTEIEPQSRIKGVASGELEGVGCWQFSEVEDGTFVRYNWQVVANKWWMKWMAPIAKPVFEWNHDVVMEWGRQGLINRVQTTSPVSA